jgi:hypothetical protein
MQRQAVEPRLVPQLRQYRRLWLSRVDLEEAKATVDELLRARLPLPRSRRPSPLLMALTTALVVAYARPFVNSRGSTLEADRTVPGSLLRALTARQRLIHNALVEMRNRDMAHSDADLLELHLILHPDGDGAILRATRNPFLRDELRDIRRIIEKLEAEVDRRCELLRQALPLEVWI